MSTSSDPITRPETALPPSPAEIARLARSLPSLHGPALDLIRARKTSPVAIVLELSGTARDIDLANPDGAAFRRRFNGFYGVRRNPAWKAVFYAEFERLKAAAPDLSPVEMFSDLLDAVAARTGRTEASFASKAVSALRGEGSIIDKVVRTRLAAIMSPPRFGGRDRAIAYYGWLQHVFDGLGRTQEGLAWGEAFDDAFAHVPGAAALHIHRKLDFLIWGGRSVPLETL